MDEEKGIGNIVFYIILAIIAIVSLFKSKKKREQGMPGGGERAREPGRGGFPDDMFDDYEEETSPGEVVITRERPEPAYRQPVPIVVSRVPEMEGYHEEPMAAAFSNEGVSALDHIETTRRFDELLKESMSYEWEDHEQDEADKFEFDFLAGDFEGRKAVIFSEIINRKEY